MSTENFIGITPIPVLIADCELHKHSIYSRRVVLADTLCFVLHPPFTVQPVGRISLLLVGWPDYVTEQNSAVPTGRACKFKLD